MMRRVSPLAVVVVATANTSRFGRGADGQIAARTTPAGSAALWLRVALVAVVALAAVQEWSVLGTGLDRQESLSGLVVGLLVGLTGMGSGALLAPILILIIGVPPVTAVGTDLAFAFVTKVAGGAEHARQRTANYRIAGLLALGSMPAGLAGIVLLEYLDRAYDAATINAVMLRLLGGVLIVSAVCLTLGLFLNRSTTPAPSSARHAMSRPGIVVALGAVVGLLVGMTSVGAGSMVVATLSLVSPLPAATIVGTDIVHAVVLTSVTAAAHGLSGNIDVGLLLRLLAGSIPGVLLGSRLTLRLPPSTLRALLAVVLLLTGLKLL
jgi:uncharacterized membrane protein YfcA